MTSPPPQALLAKTGVFARCWQESLAALARPLPVALLLPLLVAEGLLLLALYRFPRGPLDAVLAPLFVFIGGERALHYPDAWIVLPTAFLWSRRLVAFLVGSVCAAAVVATLPEVFRGCAPRPKQALEVVGRRLPSVWAVCVPELILVGGCGVLADALEIATVRSHAWTALLVFAIRASAVVVHALFAYALVALVTSDLSPGAAVRRSLQLATHNFWLSVGFVLVAQSILWPISSLESDPLRWFAATGPEIVFGFAGARIVMSLLGTFLLTATCTRLYLHWYGRVLLD